jgi:hypothetical protein
MTSTQPTRYPADFPNKSTTRGEALSPHRLNVCVCTTAPTLPYFPKFIFSVVSDLLISIEAISRSARRLYSGLAG